ncbi:hypothetical protein [Nonomuraea guangzhouensis]|uniref:Uncharacterized protein n=1 Tax=Nonomuraea guangzhouensis TaxID=1291555 RepID=A0ABW4G3R4_9ACTN|nr:hypothetical protein [Nonomuraea guangzhouensis]
MIPSALIPIKDPHSVAADATDEPRKASAALLSPGLALEDLIEGTFGDCVQRPRGFADGALLSVRTADEALAGGGAQFVRQLAALAGV